MAGHSWRGGVLGMAMALAILGVVAGSGCAIRSALTVVERVRAVNGSVLPSWQQSDTFELVDAQVPFSALVDAGPVGTHWTFGYDASGQGQFRYGPLPLGQLDAASALQITGASSASATLPLGPLAASPSLPIPGLVGQTELVLDTLRSFPAGSGVQAVDQVVVDSGALTLGVTNPLSLDLKLQLELSGLQLPGSSGPATLTLLAKAGQAATTRLDLSGATVTPPSDGRLPVWLRASVPAGELKAASGALSAFVAVSPLKLRSLTGSFALRQVLATRSFPVSITGPLAKAIVPRSARLSLTLVNGSSIGGTLEPTVVGHLKDGRAVPLVLSTPGSPAGHPSAFSGAFAPEATTAIVIDDSNSNLLDVLAADLDRIDVGGTLAVGGQHLTITASSSVAASLGGTVPLSLAVAPFGPGTANPAIAIRPPSPLAIAPDVARLIRLGLEQAHLKVTVDNGWQLPLDLSLLFSKTSDPFSDPDALAEVIHLGAGPTTISDVTLNASQSRELPDFQTLGMRLSSAGTSGQTARLHASDVLRVRIVGEFGVEVSGGLLAGALGSGR